LENDTSVVSGIPWQEQDPKLALELLDLRLQRFDLVCGKGSHLRIGGAVFRDRGQLGELALRLAQLLNHRDDRRQLRELLIELGIGRLVDAMTELRLDHLPALDKLLEFFLRNRAHIYGRTTCFSVSRRTVDA